MMKLNDVNLLSLQTSLMKNDPTTIAMCGALDSQFRQLAEEVKYCLIYARVDELDHAALDELAWQLHIDWYDAAADIGIKRRVIKSAPAVHSYLGTPAAVERVIQDYFGDGRVEEWFEYGGEPGMFRIVTENAAVSNELAAQLTRVLDTAKRGSAWLEQIIISLSGEMKTYFAGVIHTGDYITVEQVV